MARTNNLNDFLTDVAGAIKEKTGDSAAIPASQFDTKIRSIETGGNYQAKTVEYTTNGTRQIVPDTNYDALSEVNVTVNVPTPAPVLQNKTATQNGSYSADPGYDGLGTVLVNVQGQVNNQDKTITQNGQYTADSGYTGLGTVTVNVPSGSGDVKLFETEQAMQTDPSPSEGDLAVIYRSETQNWDGESAVSSFYFPDTVTFITAISEEFWVYGDGSSGGECRINGMVSASSADFRVENWDTGLRCEITYTSSDGLTYTRTDSEGNPIDLGDAQTFRMYEWDEKAGEFIQAGGKTFEGLYEYGTDTDANISCLGIKFSDLYPTYNQNILYQYNSNLTDLARLNEDDIYVWTNMAFKIQSESNLYYGQTLYKPIEGYSPLNNTNVSIGQMIENNTNYLIAYMISSPADKTLLHYTGSGFENVNILTNEWQSFTVSSSTYYYKILAIIDPTEWVANYRYSLFSMGNSGTSRPNTFTKTGSTATASPGGSYAVTPTYGISTKYFYAQTQFNSDETDLFMNKTAYSKNGIIVGNGEVANKIGLASMLNSISGVDVRDLDLVVDNDGLTFPNHGISLLASTSPTDTKHSITYMYRLPNQQLSVVENSIANNIIYNSEILVSIQNDTTNKQMILRKIDYTSLGDTYEDVICEDSSMTAGTWKCVQANDNLAFAILRITTNNKYRMVVYKLENNTLTKISDELFSNAAPAYPNMFDAIYNNKLYIAISTTITNILVYCYDTAFSLLYTINLASNFDYHHGYIIGKANNHVYIGGVKEWGGDAGTFYHKVLHINSLNNSCNLISKSFSNSQSDTWFIRDYCVLYNGDNIYLMPYVTTATAYNMMTISPTDLVMSKTLLRLPYSFEIPSYYDITNSKAVIMNGIYTGRQFDMVNKRWDKPLNGVPIQVDPNISGTITENSSSGGTDAYENKMFVYRFNRVNYLCKCKQNIVYDITNTMDTQQFFKLSDHTICKFGNDLDWLKTLPIIPSNIE